MSVPSGIRTVDWAHFRADDERRTTMKLLANPANWARVGLCPMLGAGSFAIVDVAPAAAVSGPVVTNCDDAGPGSLRQAVADATASDTVTFAPAPACSLITLTSGAIQSFF